MSTDLARLRLRCNASRDIPSADVLAVLDELDDLREYVRVIDQRRDELDDLREYVRVIDQRRDELADQLDRLKQDAEDDRDETPTLNLRSSVADDKAER